MKTEFVTLNCNVSLEDIIDSLSNLSYDQLAEVCTSLLEPFPDLTEEVCTRLFKMARVYNPTFVPNDN